MYKGKCKSDALPQAGMAFCVNVLLAGNRLGISMCVFIAFAAARYAQCKMHEITQKEKKNEKAKCAVSCYNYKFRLVKKYGC